jgi:hypothetical protein
MSLFDNAERRVENHKTGVVNKYDKFGRKIVNVPPRQEIVEEQVTAKIIQGPETVKPELSEGEKHYREVKVQNAINKNNSTNYLQQLAENTKVGVLENVLTSVYYDALFLDDDFKEHNAAVIQEAVHDHLVEKGGYKYIEEAYDRTKSPLIKAIMDICEETSKEVNKKEIKKMNEDMSYTFGKLFKFKLEEEEKQKLDYNKESIGLKQISNVVKDKMLNVVKEEKKRETEHSEMMDEIEKQLSDDPEVNDAEAVAEALNKIFINNVNIEEGTLFNSLLRTNYKKVLESGYDALRLDRMTSENDISDVLNSITLENVLIDDEFKEIDSLSNEKIKDIFDDFVNNINIQENPDLDDVVESFANVQDRFTEVANNTINKTDLYQIRNDFRILQETFEEVIDKMDISEEGKNCGGKECSGLDKKNLTIVNDANLDKAKEAKNPPGSKQDKAKQKENGDVIDTIFDQDALRGKNKKTVKEEYDDIDDELEFDDIDDEFDITEEGSNGPGMKFYIKNYGTLYMNALKAPGDINRIQPGLMKIVKRCKTMREIEYLQKDASHSVSILNSHIKNFKDDKKKMAQYKTHIKWIESVYRPAISAKKKEIKEKENSKKKVVKESIVQILEECVSIVDERIQMHDNADEFARNTVLENYMGENVLIPIIKKSDMQLDGLKLAYKMKHVLESLTVLINDYEGADNTALIKNAVESNKSNVRFVLESFKGIPSTPVYKINFFNTFNDLLQIVDENVNEMCTLYENFDMTEIDYDDVNGDLLIDDENNTFRILTECADDNPINGEVECIDMDFILADTIMEYTLLETMYTLQLEDFKYNDIKKITNNMLNDDIIMEAKNKKSIMKTIKDADKMAGKNARKKINERNEKKEKRIKEIADNQKKAYEIQKQNFKHLVDSGKDAVNAYKDTIGEFKETGKNIKNEIKKSKKKK